VDELLTPTAAPGPPVNNYNNAMLTDPDVPFGQTWVAEPINYAIPALQAVRNTSFQGWWMQQQLSPQRSIHEKLTLFWHNHFPTQLATVGVAQAMYNYYATLRQHATGNFKALTKAITLDVAMLRYLNGYLNTKTAPDENYGRELQELFTVGKDGGTQYTEDDVKAAARVLTGYRINPATLTYFFDSSQHDTTNKQFSALYSNTVIAGKAGTGGEQELDEMLDMIFAVDEVAKHLCRRLYMFFVYYDINASVEANVIAPLADILRNNNYDLAPVLDALFKSEHFFDPLNMGCFIKSPIDFTIGMMREFEVQQTTDLSQQFYHFDWILQQASYIGLEPGNPPNVAGWYAYYMAPMYHEIWINSDTLPKRIELANTMGTNGHTQNGYKTVIDPIAFAATMPNPGDPDILVADSVKYLYPYDVSQAGKDFLKSYLLSGQTSNSYWTMAWDDFIANPTDIAAYNAVHTRLQAFYKALMTQAEYQLA